MVQWPDPNPVRYAVGGGEAGCQSGRTTLHVPVRTDTIVSDIRPLKALPEGSRLTHPRSPRVAECVRETYANKGQTQSLGRLTHPRSPRVAENKEIYIITTY